MYLIIFKKVYMPFQKPALSEFHKILKEAEFSFLSD